jgi:hypothetical protein
VPVIVLCVIYPPVVYHIDIPVFTEAKSTLLSRLSYLRFCGESIVNGCVPVYILLVHETTVSSGERLLLCSPPYCPLPVSIPLILDTRHCCVRELLYGPALGRLEPCGRVAVARPPGAIALRAPGLPARPEPPLVEHLHTRASQRVGPTVRKQMPANMW